MTARSGLSSLGLWAWVPAHTRGNTGTPPGGKVSVALQRVLSQSIANHGKGEKGKEKRRWDARKWREKKTNQQHKCKAEKRKRQLKRKYKDAISESAENKVSSVGLTRATKTTSRHACASASILLLALGEWHRPVAGCSAAYTFFLKKPPSGQSQQRTSGTAFRAISP